MAYVALALLVTVVVALSWIAQRSGRAPSGCCAPADPHEDLRMCQAFTTEERRERPHVIG